MSSKQDIWMPLYIADYLADTTRLNTEQHGAYLLLIMDYWRNGAPPNDDDVLANITRLSIAQWRKHKPTLLRLFVLNDGFLTHKRIEDELLKASENADKYAERAKKAAAKRWNKESSSNATSIPSSNSKAELGDMLADATSPSPSSIKPTEITHSKETNTSNAKTQVGVVCVAIKKIFDSAKRSITGMDQQNPKLLACIEAGATVDEFMHAAQVAIEKNKGFDYLVGVVVKQRQDVAKLGLHQGAMPTTNYQQGVTTAAASVFKPEYIAEQTKNNEVNYERPAITA